MSKAVEWVLRIGIFGIFLGHGIIALSVNPDWIRYLTTIGFSPESSAQLMPVIGGVDLLVATLTIIRPLRPESLMPSSGAFLRH